MFNMIEKFVNNMSKDDIINFANKNNLKVTNHEIDFIYSFIKSNYKEVLNNPNSFDIALYKNEFSNENYLFIKQLIDKYKRMI